jgi:hypothetical protein
MKHSPGSEPNLTPQADGLFRNNCDGNAKFPVNSPINSASETTLEEFFVHNGALSRFTCPPEELIGVEWKACSAEPGVLHWN